MNSHSPSSLVGGDGTRGGVQLRLIGSIVRGACGFAIVSLAGFGAWAIGGKWLHARLGEAGVYAGCLLAFLGASGLFLHPLIHGTRRIVRFYRVFIPAFLGYAIVWCAAWYALRFGIGEWLASFLGSIAFVAVAGWGLGNYRGCARAVVVLFVCHSAGYFLGGKFMYWLAGPGGASWLAGIAKAQRMVIAELGWGVIYGLGFGAGMGFVFHRFQRK